MSTTPITDRIAAQVADTLAARGQALVQVRTPSLDVERVNRALGRHYTLAVREDRLCLVRVDADVIVEYIRPSFTPAIIATLADVHDRGTKFGRYLERQHADARAKASPKRAARKAPEPEVEAVAAGPSL